MVYHHNNYIYLIKAYFLIDCMNKFTWNMEKFSTSYKVIDHEHQFFVKSFNDLVDQCIDNQAPNWEACAGHLGELLAFLRKHFKTEEALLCSSNAPHYQQHQQEHDLLCKSLDQALNRSRSLTDINLIMQQLFEWMDVHLELEAEEFRKLQTATPTQS